MDSLLNQVNFDLLTCQYLEQIKAAISPANLAKARELFQNDPDLILDAIFGIDEVRKISIDRRTIGRIKQNKRYKHVVA